MTERTWMKKCCGLCPYAQERTLWLHPNRAEDFAYQATNPFNDFPCHKTADFFEDEQHDGDNSGFVFGEQSFTCHGFKTLQVNENGEEDGFVADGVGFYDTHDMIGAHTEHWEEEQAAIKKRIADRG